MAKTYPLLVEKRITSCKAKDRVLEEGDEVQFTIEIKNQNIDAFVGTICDELPADLLASVEWSDTLGNSGSDPLIEQAVTIPMMSDYEMTIDIVVGPLEECVGRTMTNVVEVKPDATEEEPCPESIWAKSEACYFGCEEPRYDPCFGVPSDMKMLALLLDYNEYEWCKVIDAVNAGEVGIPGLPGAPGEDGLDGATVEEICDLLIQKLEEGTPDDNAFKDAILACINETITKDFLGEVLQEGN